MESIGTATQPGNVGSVETLPQIQNGQTDSNVMANGDKAALNANSVKGSPTDYPKDDPTLTLAQNLKQESASIGAGNVGKQMQQMFSDFIQEFVNLIMSLIQSLSSPNGPVTSVQAPATVGQASQAETASGATAG